VPEIISRSKRPGSAFQNSFLIQHSETSGATTALMNKNDKKTNSTVNAKQKTTVTTSTVEIENDIDQNPGNFFDAFDLFALNEMFKEIFSSKECFIDLPPKYFVIKENQEFFKPKIHVEMDNADKLDTVTEIHIKGWKLEKPIIEVLSLCLPAIDNLNTLK